MDRAYVHDKHSDFVLIAQDELTAQRLNTELFPSQIKHIIKYEITL